MHVDLDKSLLSHPFPDLHSIAVLLLGEEQEAFYDGASSLNKRDGKKEGILQCSKLLVLAATLAPVYGKQYKIAGLARGETIK